MGLSFSSEYPWRAPQYREDLLSRVRTALPESYDGPVYLYLPTLGLVRHYILTVRLDPRPNPILFLRSNLSFVVYAVAAIALLVSLISLIDVGIRFGLGPIAFVSFVATVGALITGIILLIVFKDDEIDWSPLFARQPLHASLDEYSQMRNLLFHDIKGWPARAAAGRYLGDADFSADEQNVRFLLRERIGLWLTGVATAEDTQIHEITEGPSGPMTHKVTASLRDTLNLTDKQFEHLHVPLLDELRSAAAHELIGGNWGRLLNLKGTLTIERRYDGPRRPVQSPQT